MPPEAAAAAAAATAAAAAEAAELLSSSGGERLQLLLGPRTTVGGGGERLSVEGGGTGGSGDGKGFGREKSSNADSNGLYGVLPPPETRPPTAAAGVEADAAAAEVMVLLAAVWAGHMMMIPLSSPMFVRLVRLLASARMVKVVVDDCSEGARVTMVMPAMWYFSPFFCESSNSPNYCCRMPYFGSRHSVLFILVVSHVARTTRYPIVFLSID